MPRTIRAALLGLLLLSYANRADGQADLETWVDLTTRYRHSERWTYLGDFGVRASPTDYNWTLYYIRPSWGFRVRPWFRIKGGAGFTGIFQGVASPSPNSYEIRPWQGLLFAGPAFRGYAFSHYVRLEERVIWTAADRVDVDYTTRSRYQLVFRTPDYNIFFDRGLHFAAGVELFWNLETPVLRNFAGRLRWDLSAGTRFRDGWRIDLHYILQEGRDDWAASPVAEEHILRLRLHCEFD